MQYLLKLQEAIAVLQVTAAPKDHKWHILRSTHNFDQVGFAIIIDEQALGKYTPVGTI